MTPVLVTGAGKGLGSEICKKLAADGHDIVIHYRKSESQACIIAKECRRCGVHAETIYGDFSSHETVNCFLDTYLKRFTQTKGLVNNVGNYLIASPISTDIFAWHELFQTNFFTPILLSQSLLSSLRKHKGSIVNIGVSGLSAKRGFIHTTPYAATKSALFFYTLSLAKEVAKDCVRVNMVSPGYMENAVDLAQATDIPYKRPAYLREVAELVAFLLDTEKSAYITGQNIEIAGGLGL